MRPYVIVAPGYTEKSWGVRTLHQLCHMLNMLDVPAYMLLIGGTATRLDWQTPAARSHHLRDGIVIYPEVVTDNFLGAKRVVRWLLNRSGYINGTPVQYGPDDFVVAWSRMIDVTLPILNLQITNDGVFHPRDLPEKRGELFYVGKGRGAARSPLLEHSRTEITREWPSTHPELATLLRRSLAVYSYDTLSGINYEATLCGTLCVIIPNGPYTRDDIARGELGLNGIAWGTAPAEVERAVRTLPDAWPRYLEVIAQEPAAVQAFVEATQTRWSRG
jgi:hypothetical protein